MHYWAIADVDRISGRSSPSKDEKERIVQGRHGRRAGSNCKWNDKGEGKKQKEKERAIPRQLTNAPPLRSGRVWCPALTLCLAHWLDPLGGAGLAISQRVPACLSACSEIAVRGRMGSSRIYTLCDWVL